MKDKLKKKTLQLKKLRIAKERERQRLLKLKKLQKKQNNILNQIK